MHRIPMALISQCQSNIRGRSSRILSPVLKMIWMMGAKVTSLEIINLLLALLTRSLQWKTTLTKMKTIKSVLPSQSATILRRSLAKNQYLRTTQAVKAFQSNKQRTLLSKKLPKLGSLVLNSDKKQQRRQKKTTVKIP